MANAYAVSGRDNEYEQIVKNQVAQTRTEAERDGVKVRNKYIVSPKSEFAFRVFIIKVPTTVEDYCIKTVFTEQKSTAPELMMDMDFYYSDDNDVDDDEFEDEHEDDDNEDVEMVSKAVLKKAHLPAHTEASSSKSVPPTRD